MKTIIVKKNNGMLMVEKLPVSISASDLLKDGDEYVYMKKNRVLNWNSPHAVNDEIGKVIWRYKLQDESRFINKFSIEDRMIMQLTFNIRKNK